MLKQQLRPLLPEERKTLESCANSSRFNATSAFMAFLFPFFIVFVAIACFAAVLAALHVIEKSTARSFENTGALMGIAVGMWVVRKSLFASRKALQPYKLDLEEGIAESFTCHALGAVEVEEFEDEGPAFFIDVGEPRLLFLQGQYLYDLVEDGKFPCSDFEVVRAPQSGLNLGLQCLGEPLKSTRKRRWLTDKEYLPSDLELVGASIATLDEDLLRLRNSEQS